MLDRPGADPAVGLPESDRVVVSSRGQNDRVAAHRPLVHIHASLLAVTARSEACMTLQRNVGHSQLLRFSDCCQMSTFNRNIVFCDTVEIKDTTSHVQANVSKAASRCSTAVQLRHFADVSTS